MPLGSFSAITRLRALKDVNLGSITDGESITWDAGTSKFLPGSGGGGGTGGSSLIGDTLTISADTTPVDQDAPNGFSTFTELTHDLNQFHEGSDPVTWLTIDADATRLVLEAGTYIFSARVELSVGAGNGTLEFVPKRTGSGPATNFLFFALCAGDNLAGNTDNQITVVDGYGTGRVSYVVSVPSATAHRTIKFQSVVNLDAPTYSGDFVVNAMNVVKIA